MVFRLKNPLLPTREAARIGSITIMEPPPSGSKKQKVTTITQYRNTEMLLVTLSTGYLAVVNVQKLCTVSSIKAHKGNISGACFLNDFEMFATASGSFKGKTDNTIQVYKIFLTLGELLVRKLHSLSNIHGR